MIKNCLLCNKKFYTKLSRIKKGRGKYCSKECSNKGTIHKPNLGCFKKGEHRSPKTEFKKGDNLREKHFNWKGGRRKSGHGYIKVNVLNHPKKYRNGVYEHIIVAEKKLGRYLIRGEVVHHINGIKDDNRPENLIVIKTNVEHLKLHRKE